MPSDPVASVIGLIRQNYHPFADVTDLLCSLLEVALSATRSTQAEICLTRQEAGGEQTDGVLILNDARCRISEPLTIANCELCRVFFEGDAKPPPRPDNFFGEARCVRLAHDAKSVLALPIRYQGTALGLLVLASGSSDHYKAADRAVCQWIASEIAYHLKRYELSETVKTLLGKDSKLIGTSDALRKVDEFVERASPAKLPALILGEFGSEKTYVAHALHMGDRQDRPFFEVRCAALDPLRLTETMSDHLRGVDGGTIFFNGIDELEYQAQCRLSDVIESEAGGWTGRPFEARLMASAGPGLDKRIEARTFSPTLLEKFDFLVTEVAPLRSRRADIRPLVEHFLNKHTRPPTRLFSGEVLELFEGYGWPGNLYELERVVARLAVMSDEEVIGMKDVYAHAPKLAAPTGPRDLAIPEPAWSEVEGKTAIGLRRVDTRLVRLARNLIKGDYSELGRFHPGLQNALRHVAQNLHEAISLHDLARHAGLSASHLSYLFQKTLGFSFKSFLAVMRIEEAKQLLVEKPHLRITEISFQVGFGDLSHFERMFKRLVGQPPREYRILALGPEETQGPS